MKTMQDFTIYCTEQQTRRAFKLGAPIKHISNEYGYEKGDVFLLDNIVYIADRNAAYKIPTAEQMIGWLESHEEFFNICVRKTMGGNYSGTCYCGGKTLLHQIFSSRKEATLTAIDAAFDGLFGEEGKIKI